MPCQHRRARARARKERMENNQNNQKAKAVAGGQRETTKVRKARIRKERIRKERKATAKASMQTHVGRVVEWDTDHE
eukprot:838371-Amphidinium_carterae.1